MQVERLIRTIWKSSHTILWFIYCFISFYNISYCFSWHFSFAFFNLGSSCNAELGRWNDNSLDKGRLPQARHSAVLRQQNRRIQLRFEQVITLFLISLTYLAIICLFLENSSTLLASSTQGHEELSTSLFKSFPFRISFSNLKNHFHTSSDPIQEDPNELTNK